MSISNCCFFTCMQALRRQVRWSSIPISFRIFQFLMICTVKCFSIVNEAEVDVLLEFPCFFSHPENVGSLISGFSAFSKTSLNIWKFMVYVMLKPGLENVSKFGKPSSGHRTGKGQFSFQSKERQCQRMLKLPHNCTHLTH